MTHRSYKDMVDDLGKDPYDPFEDDFSELVWRAIMEMSADEEEAVRAFNADFPLGGEPVAQDRGELPF